ncbi:MAG: hypothetical protein K5848_05515 [Lachnospiraceae bacterium]|nr:hypothetical protein [Lachnospiraceae bacterium]
MIKTHNKKIYRVAALFLLSACFLMSCGQKKNEESSSASPSPVTVKEDNAQESAQSVDDDPPEIPKEYYYLSMDSSVGLCDYSALTYHVIDTSVTEEELNEKMDETLDYFNNVLWLNVSEVTDELVKQYYQYESVEELKKAYYEVIKEKKDKEAIAAYKEEIIKTLVEGSDVLVDLTDESAEYYNSLMAHYKALAFAEGLTVSEYAAQKLGIGEEELETTVAADALELAKRKKIILAVAEAEGYMVTQGEYNLRVADYMEYYGYTDEAAFKNDFSEDFINENMLMDITIDNLLAKAEPVESE